MNIIQIENKKGKVSLNDSVHSQSIDRMISEIDKIFGAESAANGTFSGEITNCIENAADTLQIDIHSPGGSVLDGYRVFNAIKRMRDRGVYVTARIDTLAASMASVIAMAADKIVMTPGSKMMIHEASHGVYGDSRDHERAAKLLNEMSNEIASIYAGKTGATTEAMRELMKSETWMGPDDALARGFIDEIIGAKSAENKTIDFAAGNTTPGDMSILDRLTSPSDAEAKDKIASLETQVAEMNGKLEVAEKALQEASGFTATISDLTAKVATITVLENTITDQVATIEKLTAANVVTDEKIAHAAAAKLAAMGHGGPLDLGKHGVSGDKTHTRAEFSALAPNERHSFITSGGKLTD